MFLMDVLRHTGAARMAEFVGNTPGNVATDQAQLRTSFYTPAEANEQIVRAAAAAGARGQQLLGGIDAFVAGINRAQDDLCPTIAAPTCPAEYVGLQKQPTDWTRADIVYIASLVGGIFGKGGGNEFANADWWQALQAEFGTKEALKTYRDLREKNDPEAPTTSSRRAPYDGVAFDPTRPGVALPDLDGKTASGTGAVLRGSAPAPGRVTRAARPAGRGPRGPLRAGRARHEQRAAGHRQAVEDRQAAGGDGPADRLLRTADPRRAGAQRPRASRPAASPSPARTSSSSSAAASTTRGRRPRPAATTSTRSPRSSATPTAPRRPCSPPATGSARSASRCSPTCTPRPPRRTSAAPGPPTTYDFQVLRTRHGIVQERTTVDGHAGRAGAPAVDVRPRGRLGARLRRVQRPRLRARRASRSRRPRADIDYTFNWFYADSEDISYYSSGLLPKRSKKVEPDLPHWAGKKYDWKGWLSDRRHARETNPRARLPGQLEQQARARVLGRRRHLGLRLGLPVAGAREAAHPQDPREEADRPAGHGRRDGRGGHRRLARGVHAAVAAEGDRRRPEDRCRPASC